MNWYLSLLNISLSTANKFYTFGWTASLSGAAITFVGVVFLMWGTRVRDHDFEENIAGLHGNAATFEKEAADARERAGKLEERSISLEKDAAQARAAIADANARALEAQAELARFRAPRGLATEQQQRLIAKTNPWAGQSVSFSVTGEPEAVALMQMIRRVLASAGWNPIASQMGDIEVDGAGVAYAIGVEIQVAPGAARGTKAAGGANALAQALVGEGITAQATVNQQLKNADAINVMVGKKL